MDRSEIKDDADISTFGMAVNTRMPYYMLLYYCYNMRYRNVLLNTLVDSLSMSLTHWLLDCRNGP